MGLRPKHIYQRLNRARFDSTALKLHRSGILQTCREVKQAHAAWRHGESPACLHEASQRFIDLLSSVFIVSPKSLALANRARPHSRDEKGRLRGELFGSVSPYGNIRIYLLTPTRERPTAFKTYLNTLIHEWVHHYDFEALGDTIHCSGFYERVNTIYRLCTAQAKKEAKPSA